MRPTVSAHDGRAEQDEGGKQRGVGHTQGAVPVVAVETTRPIVVSARAAVQMPGSKMPDFGGGSALVDQLHFGLVRAKLGQATAVDSETDLSSHEETGCGRAC
jgi:hypothetical protein